MGATSFGLAVEVPEFLSINIQENGEEGDFPSVQMLDDTGAPIGIVSWSDADAEPLGDIRIGDWDYLSNGNILIVGEDRQGIETTRLGAQTDRNVVFKIVTPSGQEVKGLTLADMTGARGEIWNGSAVVQDGFAIRFGNQVRFFNNAGAPATDNVAVGDVTGNPSAGGNGRGENVGFHGNGVDAYVLAVPGTDVDGNPAVVVTVFNADGSVRYSKSATTGYPVNALDHVDAAISPDGRVLVVFDDARPTELGNIKTVLGRLLDKDGNPAGGVFAVSEAENSLGLVVESAAPRVAWRGENAAVVWESQNNGPADSPVVQVALRTFSIAGPTTSEPINLSVTKSGNNLTLTWTGGTGPFTVQKKTTLLDAQWSDVTTTETRQATVTIEGETGFFRISGK
jgi:hypothetical protein